MTPLTWQAIAAAQQQSQQAVAQTKGQVDIVKTQVQQAQLQQSELEQIAFKVSEQLRSDLIKMSTEARLENENANLELGHGNEIKTDNKVKDADDKDKLKK